MNKYLKELIDVSLLDREIDLMEPKIKQIKKGLNSKLYQQEVKEQEILALQAQKESHKLQLAKCNETIANLGARLD